MNTSTSHAFVNQLLLGLLVMIGFGGSIGLGTVWMRHRISVVADSNAALQREIAEIDRHSTDTKALIEEAMSLDVLRSKNESMHLGMVDLTNIPIHVVPVDPTSLLVAKANRRIFERDNAGEGVGIQFKVDQAPAPAAAPATPTNSARRATPVRTAKQNLRAAASFQLAFNP